MSRSGALAGCFSFTAPESEESYFFLGSGFLQQPNNPVSIWLHASSTRKKRCRYSEHEFVEVKKDFLFNTYLTRELRISLMKAKKQRENHLKDTFTCSDTLSTQS
ncbi:hypothetical protein Q7C36_014623 [Tachysurus vachellii]|uniref:Uncharacterized protein n=1 Tax=Tachysurus vachellii TaxID=175792 RepID=A0AA88MI18_TACVA|nr:hypothetical protein Q7C36_014623 [Tachysurus vachellii]